MVVVIGVGVVYDCVDVLVVVVVEVGEGDFVFFL